jgi:hypothetical protein
MTPESQNNGARGNLPQFDKHISTAMDMCATIEEIVGNGVLYVVQPETIYRGPAWQVSCSQP